MTTLIIHVIYYLYKNTVFFFSAVKMSIYGHHSTENLVFSLETLDYESIVYVNINTCHQFPTLITFISTHWLVDSKFFQISYLLWSGNETMPT